MQDIHPKTVKTVISAGSLPIFSMKRIHYKHTLIIATCYLFTVCVIYKYMPLAQSKTGNDSDLRHYLNNVTQTRQDPYKLNWRENEKVYFKKVINLTPHAVFDDNVITENDMNCDRKSSPKFRKISAGIYIYSAYFDKRNGKLYIRMIAAVARDLTKEHLNATLTCVFNTTMNEVNRSSTLLSPLESYEMCENHKKKFGGWIFSCKVPRDIQIAPPKIQIRFSETRDAAEQNSMEICVTSRDKNVSRRKLNFGVCVPPLYGEIKAKTLIEFIEFNRILGADIFILYIENSIENLSTEVRSVLRYYERQNVVMTLPWGLPFSQDSIWYHGQSLAINDCLYKNMDDFEYLAFVDLDEFIIPQDDLFTWKDVISRMNEKYSDVFNSAVGMSFKSTFYSQEFSRHVFSNEMSMSVRINRTKHFSFRRNKVIVRPEKIFELGIHHVSKPFLEADSKNVINVPTSIAHIHHYRTCVQEFGIHCQTRIEDYSVPNKYGQFIIDNYLKIIFDITP